MVGSQLFGRSSLAQVLNGVVDTLMTSQPILVASDVPSPKRARTSDDSSSTA